MVVPYGRVKQKDTFFLAVDWDEYPRCSIGGCSISIWRYGGAYIMAMDFSKLIKGSV